MVSSCSSGYDDAEDVDMKRENVRAAVSKAMSAVASVGVTHVSLIIIQ